MTEPHLDPERRHEFVILYDVKNGNPNGDPDAGNLPRIDPETNHGLVTDVAIKRKIRDYVTITMGEKDGYGIFIQSEDALNTLIERAGDEVDIEPGSNLSDEDQRSVRNQLRANYFDVRTFGAVLSTGDLNAGQVRGPVQIGLSESVDPIISLDLSITRQAITTEEDAERKETEMGRKPIVPYALYRAHGFYNPFLGTVEEGGDRDGGASVTSDDLATLWDAIVRMFEFDRSAARGEMATRGLYVFSHDNKKGNARASELFEHVEAEALEDVEHPRSFKHYDITVEEPSLDGVEITRIVG